MITLTFKTWMLVPAITTLLSILLYGWTEVSAPRNNRDALGVARLLVFIAWLLSTLPAIIVGWLA